MSEMALRAQADDNVELWVQTRFREEVNLREAPIVEADRIELDLAYDPLSGSGFEFRLRRR